MSKCPWSTTHPLNEQYHDQEWGVPSFDEHHLFEMLCLEGMQAGLSWLIILKKRAAFREKFANFNPEKIARFTPQKIELLLQDASLIRHRAKLMAIVKNAQALLRLYATGETLSNIVWSIVDHQVQDSQPKTLHDIPTKTVQSLALSKKLKKLGFVFVGPVTCYSFMQAIGMVNDHLDSCVSRKK